MKRILIICFLLVSSITIVAQENLAASDIFSYKKVQIQNTHFFSVIDSVISSTDLTAIPKLTKDLYYIITVFKYDTITPKPTYFFDNWWSYIQAPKVDLAEYKLLKLEVIADAGFDNEKFMTTFNKKNYYSSQYFVSIYGKTISKLVAPYKYTCFWYPTLPNWTFIINKGFITSITFWYHLDDDGDNVILSRTSCNIKLWEYTGKD